MLHQETRRDMLRNLRATLVGSALAPTPGDSQRAGNRLIFDAHGNPAAPSVTTGQIDAAVAAYLANAVPDVAKTAYAPSLAAAKAMFAAGVVLASGLVVAVAGRAAINDGYEGVFAYNGSDTTTTFASDGLGFTDNQGRRFFRQGVLEVDAGWFGAKGDGTGNSVTDPDYTAEVQAALNAAWASNRDLFIPAGVYLVTGLTLPGNAAMRTRAFRMFGQGSGKSLSGSSTPERLSTA